MKIKLSHIVGSVESLKALLDVKFPIKQSYRISKLVNGPIERELKSYNEARNSLIAEFGDKNDDGSTQVKDPKKLEEFMIKMNELLDVDVEIEWEPINIEDVESLNIEPRHLISFIFA